MTIPRLSSADFTDVTECHLNHQRKQPSGVSNVPAECFIRLRSADQIPEMPSLTRDTKFENMNGYNNMKNNPQFIYLFFKLGK